MKICSDNRMEIKMKLKDPFKHKKRNLIYISLFFLIFGAISNITFPLLLNTIVRSMLEFQPGTNTYNNWVVNKEHYNYDFYLFNWTNPEDVYNKSIKPHFDELGPYRFHLFIEKINVTVHDNGTTTYNLVKKFTYAKEDGTRDINEMITTINPIPNTIAYKVRDWNIFAKLGVSLAFRTTSSQIHFTKSVKELLFDGTHDPILDAVSKIPFASSGLEDKFGYFYKKNYTDFILGPMNFHTTVDDKYGDLYTVNGNKHTDYFQGDCGKVVGSPGEFTKMNRDRNEKLVLYVPEINTYVTMQFDKEQDVKGVISDKYTPGDVLFDNGFINPENRCFCNGECVPPGMLNMSSSYKGAPVFFSMPHYYLADPYYQDAVSIPKVNPDKDGVYATYEPVSGVLTAVALRIQVNMLLQSVSGIGIYSDVPKYFIPVFYLDQAIVLDDINISGLKMLQTSLTANNVLSLTCLCVGLIILVIQILRKDKTFSETLEKDKYYYQETVSLKTEKAIEADEKS